MISDLAGKVAHAILAEVFCRRFPPRDDVQDRIDEPVEAHQDFTGGEFVAGRADLGMDELREAAGHEGRGYTEGGATLSRADVDSHVFVIFAASTRPHPARYSPLFRPR